VDIREIVSYLRGSRSESTNESSENIGVDTNSQEQK
jgi:hypothetical protein